MVSLIEYQIVEDLDSSLEYASVLLRKILMLLKLSELQVSHR